jgi:hypothetical protein
MCVETLETYKECSCKSYAYNPCSGFLRSAPDDVFADSKKLCFERCNRKVGKRGKVRKGTCGRPACKGQVDQAGDSDGGGGSEGWKSVDGSRNSMEGVVQGEASSRGQVGKIGRVGRELGMKVES